MADMDGTTLLFRHYKVFLLNLKGGGSFGKVYSGQHIKTKQAIAVKRIEMDDEDKITWALKEADIFHKIKPHENIVHILHQEYYNRYLWLIFEFCEHGSLDEYIKKSKPDEKTMYLIMLQCAKGINHLHNNNPPIVHRDIKPANVLVTIKNKRLVAKISDFGFAKHGDFNEMVQAMFLGTLCMTDGYEAPEFHETDLKYDFTIDIFSLAMLFLAMIQYDGQTEMRPRSERTKSLPKNTKALSIGLEMYKSHSNKQTMPVVVMVERNDSPELKRLKQLIKDMCAFDSGDRKPLLGVIEELKSIQGLSGTGSGDEPTKEDTLTNEDLRVLLSKQAMREQYLHLSSTIGNCSDPGDDDKDFMQKTMAEQMSTLSGLGRDTMFKIGEKVRVVDDKQRFNQHQESIGAWVEDMGKAVGHNGVVINAISADVLLVQLDDNSEVMMNTASLESKSLTDSGTRSFTQSRRAGTFKEGDIVKFVNKDKLSSFKSTKSIKPTLVKCLDVKGFVVDVDTNGIPEVHFINGTRMSCNPETLERVKADEQEGLKCETADIVLLEANQDSLMKTQKSTGVGWNDSLRSVLGKPGIVKEMAEGDLVFVEFSTEGTKDTFCISKHALKVLAKSGEWFMALLEKNKT